MKKHVILILIFSLLTGSLSANAEKLIRGRTAYVSQNYKLNFGSSNFYNKDLTGVGVGITIADTSSNAFYYDVYYQTASDDSNTIERSYLSLTMGKSLGEQSTWFFGIAKSSTTDDFFQDELSTTGIYGGLSTSYALAESTSLSFFGSLNLVPGAAYKSPTVNGDSSTTVGLAYGASLTHFFSPKLGAGVKYRGEKYTYDSWDQSIFNSVEESFSGVTAELMLNF